MAKSISDLIMDYFQKHPKKDLKHGPVVDWVTVQYLKDNPEPPRDPWRAIRKLHQEGKLIKVSKGVYRYDPNRIKEIELFDFSPEIKEEIFRRDGYKCVVCGLGRKDGVEICADLIKPKAVITLLETDKPCVWNITLSKRITHRQRQASGISSSFINEQYLMVMIRW